MHPLKIQMSKIKTRKCNPQYQKLPVMLIITYLLVYYSLQNRQWESIIRTKMYHVALKINYSRNKK